MNTETPTPETDAFFRQCALKNIDKYPDADFARDMERRLAIARDALARIDDELKRQNFTIGGTLRMMVDEALTKTDPK